MTPQVLAALEAARAAKRPVVLATRLPDGAQKLLPHPDAGAELNEQAERCRRLADATFNREVSDMLGDMAEGYERTAEELTRTRDA